MIKHLRIRHLAIIREISLDLYPGLTVITGETGAGKSILVDSLALLLGERAGAEWIRSGEKSGSVEAVFDLTGQRAVREMMEERGWEAEGDELILRRDLEPGGRGRAIIGSRLAPVSDLRRVGQFLVDLHGQHEHQTLLRPSEHLGLLDSLADLESDLRRMREQYRGLQEIQDRLATQSRDDREIARRVDRLRFEVEEIRRAAPRPGEMETLRQERESLRNREKILALAGAGVEALYEGEGAALARLEAALAAARELSRFSPDLQGPLGKAEEARLALKDLTEALRHLGREGDEDPARLEAVEDRCALLESLRRKYGPDEESILKHADQSEREIEAMTSEENSAEALDAQIAERGGACARLAEEISRRRRRAARSFEGLVQEELSKLGLKGTELRVEFRVEEEAGSPVTRDGVPVACSTTGWDQVQFLVRMNPGEPLRPLSRTASGGELSRLMLAVHLVLPRGAQAMVRVFDEVDAGIGGGVAATVGRKLKSLSGKAQVLCVTHLPQIASLADHHLAVSKRVRGGRTEVRVESLSGDACVREVARMLGGEHASEVTLRHAAEMVQRGR